MHIKRVFTCTHAARINIKDRINYMNEQQGKVALQMEVSFRIDSYDKEEMVSSCVLVLCRTVGKVTSVFQSYARVKQISSRNL